MMTALGTHAVKVKGPEDKVWYFLTPQGGLNRLRIYAARATPERCAEFVTKIEADNPGHKAKVVKL